MWGKKQRWKWGFSLLMGTRVASVFCRLWAGHFLITDPRLWLLKRQCCRLPSLRKNKVLKSSFSAWFDMTSEVHMPPIPRFLYRMIWYLQLINFPFKQNHVGTAQQFEARHARYYCLSGSYVWIAVSCMSQETDNQTNILTSELDRCKSSNLILFKGESNWIQSNANTVFKTVGFVCIDFMSHCEVI